MWQAAVIVTGVISALAQAIGKRQVARMSAFQSGLIRDMATWGLIIMLYLLNGSVELAWPALVFLGLGLVEAVAMAAYYSAQREQMAATAVFSYPFSQLLIVLSAGLFFHEWQYFDVRTLSGLANTTAIVGLVLLMTQFQQREGQKRQHIVWSTKLILSSLVIVASNLVAKWAVSTMNYSAVTFMFFEYLGIVLGGVIFVYGRGLNLKVSRVDWGWGILQGLMFGAGALWYVSLLASHPLSIASVIRRVIIVLITVIMGLWGFGERQALNSRQKWLLVLGLLLFVLVVAVNR
ncbi:MAG: hypothetical protein ABII21_03775 [bacterium]